MCHKRLIDVAISTNLTVTSFMALASNLKFD